MVLRDDNLGLRLFGSFTPRQLLSEALRRLFSQSSQKQLLIFVNDRSQRGSRYVTREETAMSLEAKPPVDLSTLKAQLERHGFYVLGHIPAASQSKLGATQASKSRPRTSDRRAGDL